jgi:FMN phosphatase YigB (HAD superfamily)
MDTILFDLDGSLLPMEQDEFLKLYYNGLTTKFAPLGFEPGILLGAVLFGTRAMLKNDGSLTNEVRFWDAFCQKLGDSARSLEPKFADFYANEFIQVKSSTKPLRVASLCVKEAKAKGYTLVLATNPVFPKVATYTRVDWAELDPEDFSLITTYENCSFCKPDLNYYREILRNIGKKAEDCIMIGNDVKEDMCASKLGMDVFLLNDNPINANGEDTSAYRRGSIHELLSFIKGLAPIE